MPLVLSNVVHVVAPVARRKAVARRCVAAVPFVTEPRRAARRHAAACLANEIGSAAVLAAKAVGGWRVRRVAALLVAALARRAPCAEHAGSFGQGVLITSKLLLE